MNVTYNTPEKLVIDTHWWQLLLLPIFSIILFGCSVFLFVKTHAVVALLFLICSACLAYLSRPNEIDRVIFSKKGQKIIVESRDLEQLARRKRGRVREISISDIAYVRMVNLQDLETELRPHLSLLRPMSSGRYCIEIPIDDLGDHNYQLYKTIDDWVRQNRAVNA